MEKVMSSNDDVDYEYELIKYKDDIKIVLEDKIKEEFYK